MKCEAKSRSGLPLKNDSTSSENGHRKYHGNASTVPVTPEEKKKVSINSTRKSQKPVTENTEKRYNNRLYYLIKNQYPPLTASQ